MLHLSLDFLLFSLSQAEAFDFEFGFLGVRGMVAVDARLVLDEDDEPS
jgi:hypothetical protein